MKQEGRRSIGDWRRHSLYPAGSIHPVKLLLAFARILQQHFGIAIWQSTLVEAVEKDTEKANDAWIVRASRGAVRTSIVIHATNAWVGSLVPKLAPYVTPVRNHLIQTTPIAQPAESAAAAPLQSPMNPPLWDGLSLSFHSGFGYLIQRPNHRVVLGGFRYLAPRLDTSVADSNTPMVPLVIDRLRSFIPQIFPRVLAAPLNQDTRVSHLWSGILGFTSTHSPLIGGIPESRGQFTLAGFSGHGMPRCTAAADRITELVLKYLDSAGCEFQALQLDTSTPATPIPSSIESDSLKGFGLSEEELQRTTAALHSIKLEEERRN